MRRPRPTANPSFSGATSMPPNRTLSLRRPALARVCAVASKGVKRLRDEASQLPELKESLANALKENEMLKASAEKMQRESNDDKVLLNERQTCW